MKYVEQQISNFTASTIKQQFPDYDPDTIYTYEDVFTSPTAASVARYKGFHYRSITPGNKGNNPEETVQTFWSKWQVSNTYAMLDFQSLTKSIQDYSQDDADYLNTDTQVDISLDSLVWDIDNSIMYKSLTATNDLPTTDFTDTSLWQNVSDIVVEFKRGRIDTLGIGYYTADEIIVEHLDTDGNVISEVTQNFPTSPNENIYDLIDYIYEPYSLAVDRAIAISVNPVGDKIRLTIKKQTSLGYASCGFLVGGQGIDMGKTEDGVPFSFNSYTKTTLDAFGSLDIEKRNIQDTVDFSTYPEKATFPRNRRRIKSIYDEIVMFILDPSENSDKENLITLGKIENAQIVAEQATKYQVSWSVMESI